MRRYILIFGFLLLLIATALSHTYWTTEPTTQVKVQTKEQALSFHDAGNYQAAIDIYMNLIDKYPADRSLYLAAGHTYRYWGKYEEAEKMFQVARTLQPDDPWIHTELGKLYRNAGKYEEAEAAFFRSIELDPNNPDPYSYGLAYLYMEIEENAKAEQALQEALRIDPDNIFAQTALADLYRETGRYQASEKQFLEILEKEPANEAWYGLGHLYLKQERFQDAIYALEQYLEHIREKAEVYYALGRAYEGAGERGQAYNAFSQASQLNPDNQQYANRLNNFKQ